MPPEQRRGAEVRLRGGGGRRAGGRRREVVPRLLLLWMEARLRWMRRRRKSLLRAKYRWRLLHARLGRRKHSGRPSLSGDKLRLAAGEIGAASERPVCGKRRMRRRRRGVVGGQVGDHRSLAWLLSFSSSRHDERLEGGRAALVSRHHRGAGIPRGRQLIRRLRRPPVDPRVERHAPPDVRRFSVAPLFRATTATVGRF